MKKISLFACALVLLCGAAIAQKPVKEHYTASGGLLGAGNLSKFRLIDNANIDYDYEWGWSAGLWANFPLGKVVSLEPQLQYSTFNYRSDVSNTLLSDGRINYFSIPVLFKFHFGKYLALTAGPQLDLRTGITDNRNILDKEDITTTSLAATGGLEINPHGRFTIFGRYIHGLTNMDNTGNPNAVGEWRNTAFQVGAKIKLFGKLIPGDADGDGVIDKDDKCPQVVGLARYEGCPIPDSDGDGINDELDKCPQVAGLAKYQGCPIPDSDGDGINDEQDKCPQQAGVAAYQGCPVPDSDGDGIKDDVDKCPNQPGLAKYQGCPIPDTDGDGINDEQDRCPTVAGVARMQGCPEIDYTAHAVRFAVNSAKLTSEGEQELDKLYEFLNTHPDVRVRLDGYTDASGNDKINIPLSQNRAKAAKDYLVGKGINESRIETEGHGSADPLGDNNTKEGKAINRRIEVTVL